MISKKQMITKISALADDLGGSADSFVIVLAKGGEAIAGFDGSIEQTSQNLAEGFDYFVTKLVENRVPPKACGEILQSLHQYQNESVQNLSRPKTNLTLVK